MRHGERPDHGLGRAFPPPAGRVAETRGASRGVKEGFRGVNRKDSPSERLGRRTPVRLPLSHPLTMTLGQRHLASHIEGSAKGLVQQRAVSVADDGHVGGVA